jgi:hypothetical protein
MDYSTFFLTIAFGGIFAYVMASILIVNELQKRGIKINFIFLKMFIIKYAHQYKEITKKETGRVGQLFYVWIISVNVALVCAVLGLMLR